MVRINDIMNLGFTPTSMDGEFTSFLIINKNESDEWLELKIKFNFETGECVISFAICSKSEIKSKELWRGNISSIEQLEDKLQEVDGED